MEKWEIPTNTENQGAAILPDAAQAVEACLARRGLSKDQVLGLGVGVPGPVRRDGVVGPVRQFGLGHLSFGGSAIPAFGASGQSGQ